MRTLSAVVALTAAGVVLTGGLAQADATPSPTGGAWSTSDVSSAPLWTSTTITEAPSASPSSEPIVSAGGVSPSSTHTVPARRTSRLRPASRAANRQVTGGGCRPLSDGVWNVLPGDTTWLVATCTRHSVAELVTANGLPRDGSLIFPGDRITIPAS